jgi:hypothetical protein
MDEVNNPYRPGAGAQPPALIGRDEVIHRFGVTIRRALVARPGKSLMPIGLRGVGKTVLLNRFNEIAENEGFHTAYIEASETGEFRSILAARLRKVAMALDRRGPSEAVMRLLRMLKAFSFQLPDGSSMTLDIEPLRGQADSGILIEDVSDLMRGIGEAARSCGTGFLLSIDEVQYLSSEELAALITGIHRTAQLDLPVVLAGAGLPQLPGLAGEARSYAERLFEFPRIFELNPEEAEEALQVPARNAGAEFTEDALREIVHEAHGYPYFLQEWGYHIWNLAATSPFTAQDAERAKRAVISSLDQNFFLVRFGRLTPKEREYLRAMAHLGAGPHRSGEIAECLGVRVESVAPRRSALIKKGMIYSPAHGDTAFTVPLFDEYLKRAMPTWSPAPRRGFSFSSDSN